MRNPYRDLFGVIAVLAVVVGLFMLLFGNTGDFGYIARDETDPAAVLVTLGTYAIALGALCGLLWLLVAALTYQQPATSQVTGSRDDDEVGLPGARVNIVPKRLQTPEA